MSESPYRPPAAPVGDATESKAERKHSGLGIASFTLSIISMLLTFALFVIAGMVAASTPGGMDEKSPVAVLVGLSMFAFLFLSLVALGLGIGGLFQSNRRKVFAILGAVFSAATIIGAVSLMVVGLTVK